MLQQIAIFFTYIIKIYTLPTFCLFFLLGNIIVMLSFANKLEYDECKQ